MKKLILTATSLLFFASAGFSLQELNCSDALGEFKRVEQEVWGMNKIWWELSGVKFGDDVVISEVRGTKKRISGDSKNGHYVVDVKVEYPDSATPPMTKKVLCYQWSNNALD